MGKTVKVSDRAYALILSRRSAMEKKLKKTVRLSEALDALLFIEAIKC